MGMSVGQVILRLGLKCMNHPRRRLEFRTSCSQTVFNPGSYTAGPFHQPHGSFILCCLKAKAWREGLESALSQDVFVASHFCVISKCESTVRGRLNSDLETSIEVLYMPGYKKRSRSSPGLWGAVDKCGFNRRTPRTPDSTQDSSAHLQLVVNCSIRKRDGEGLGLHACPPLVWADECQPEKV